MLRKLQGANAANRLEPTILTEVIDGLFPQHMPLENAETNDNIEVTDFSQEEVDAAVNRHMTRNKAPGPDYIPSRVWGAVHRICPSLLTGILNKCLRAGEFPKQ